MNPFDEKHSQPPPDPAMQEKPSATPREESFDELAARIVVHEAVPAEPTTLVEPPPRASSPVYAKRDDFPIAWSTWPFWGSWVHFAFFLVFVFGVLVAFQIGLASYSFARHIDPNQILKELQANPVITVVSNVILFLLVFLFLYLTLGVLQGRPFWPTLGWRKLGVVNPDGPTSPWIYFTGGIGLAISVAIVSFKIKTPEHLPIQDLFKNRTGAMLLMGMAVLIAPLVEETVFRGYFYPLFASTSSHIAKALGVGSDDAVRVGTRGGIVVTGILFGFLHGAQLGWTWALVAVLSIVGVIFTYARARAGTVFASYLLHLGYNSFIAFSAIVSTRFFTRMPPHP